MNADSAHVAPPLGPPRLAGASQLLRAGAWLFAASLLNGFAIQATRLQRLALSAHLVGLFGAAFLFALAGVWPQLAIGRRTSRIGVALAIYGFVVGWMLYFTAAVTGVAGLFPMAGAGAQGTPMVEAMMRTALLTVALALFGLVALLSRHARVSGPVS